MIRFFGKLGAFLRGGESGAGTAAGKRKVMIREEIRGLKAQMEAAPAVLAKTRPPDPQDPTPAELATGVDFIFQQHEAQYLLEAQREPARIVGWLMASLIGERAIFMDDASNPAPIVGTVDANQVQKMQRVVGDRKSVALVDLPMEKQIGELYASPDVVAALPEADLPVWELLLTD
jgi:hypothetical protein